MQSWADTGFGQLREAGAFPSRAAVIGLIAAAQGIPRGDARLVELHEALRIHVATKRAGRVLRDFHTVETRVGKARTLTTRGYRHDAHFVALVTGEPGAVAEAEAALERPHFVAFLGRRACPPMLPLTPVAIGGDPFEALVAAARASAETLPEPLADEAPRPVRRWGRSDQAVTVWLDGHFAPSVKAGSEPVPEAFAGARLTHGTRRARLVGPRRAYAASPFTRADPAAPPAQPPTTAPTRPRPDTPDDLHAFIYDAAS